MSVLSRFTTASSLASGPSSPQDEPKPPSSLPLRSSKQSKKLSKSPPSSRLLYQNSKQPSLIEIEREVGAGSYRDSETGEPEPRRTIFDGILPGGSSRFEGPVEKRLRMAGEFVATRTETAFRSSGKRILLIMFQFVLPAWTMALLVACGAVKLPFEVPFLDDLLK